MHVLRACSRYFAAHILLCCLDIFYKCRRAHETCIFNYISPGHISKVLAHQVSRYLCHSNEYGYLRE